MLDPPYAHAAVAEALGAAQALAGEGRG